MKRTKTNSQALQAMKVAAARVVAMEAEKLFLQKLHGEMQLQWLTVGERIARLSRQIKDEKEAAASLEQYGK